MNDYFLRGLVWDLRTALATVDKSTTTLDNVKQQAILAGETLLGDLSDSKRNRQKSGKHHSRKKLRSKSSSDSDSDSIKLDSSTSSDSSSRKDSAGWGKNNPTKKGSLLPLDQENKLRGRG